MSSRYKKNNFHIVILYSIIVIEMTFGLFYFVKYRYHRYLVNRQIRLSLFYLIEAKDIDDEFKAAHYFNCVARIRWLEYDYEIFFKNKNITKNFKKNIIRNYKLYDGKKLKVIILYNNKRYIWVPKNNKNIRELFVLI